MGNIQSYSDDIILDIANSDIEQELRNRGYKYGWYKQDSYIGYIYILVNPAFPNLVKLGYADDIACRLRTLNRNSGIPDPYHCYAAYRVKKRLEDLKLHDLIDTLNPSLRHSQNREFYEMSVEDAYNILSIIAKITGTEEQLVKNPLNDTYFDSSITGSYTTDSNSSFDNNSKRVENTTFKMLGIPVGSDLVFIKDRRIIVKTVNDINRVVYNNTEYGISTLAAKLLNIQTARGYSYFTYNGELLTDIRARLGK